MKAVRRQGQASGAGRRRRPFRLGAPVPPADGAGDGTVHPNRPGPLIPLGPPDRPRPPFRPSAPILLVASAVVLIAGATELTNAGVRPSLPAAITLPGPTPAATPASTGARTRGSARPPASGPAVTDSQTATSVVAHPPIAVSPSYPVGTPRSGGSAAPNPSVSIESPSPSEQGPPQQSTTTTPALTPTTDYGASDDGTSSDGTQTVPPNYPVVTASPGSTTTSVPVPSTTDR